MAVCSNYLVATLHWWTSNMEIEKKEKEKRKRKKKKENLKKLLIGLLCYCTLLLKEFLWFSIILTSVKTIVLVRTAIVICLIISLAVHIFEDMRIWLTNFGNCIIKFLVFSATLCLLSMVFSRISFIALGTSRDMRVTTKCWVTPLPTVFTLRSSQICVCTSNGSNILSYIKTTVDDVLHWRTALWILYINPNHCHVRFKGYFNDSWLRS